MGTRNTNVTTRSADPMNRTLSMQMPSSLQPVTERNVMLPSGTNVQQRTTTRSASPSMHCPMTSVPLPRPRPSSAGPNTVPRSPCRSMAVEQAHRPASTGSRVSGVPGTAIVPATTRENAITSGMVTPLVLPPADLPRSLPTGLLSAQTATMPELTSGNTTLHFRRPCRNRV